jgi:TonB family protein
MKIGMVLATLAFFFLVPQTSPEPQDSMCLCKFVAPRYSAIARQAVIEGIVHVQIDVGPDGLPTGISIIDRANQILGESAVNAVKSWKLCPSRGRNGTYKLIVTFVFKLEGQPTQKWAGTDISFGAPATVTITTPSGVTLQSDGG